MKINKLSIITITLSALLVFSCASTKKVDEIEADAYGDEIVEKTTTKKAQKEIVANTEEDVKATIYKRSYTDKLKDIFTFGNKKDFLKTDRTSVFAPTITQSIKQQNANIYISTREDIAGYGSQYMTAFYMVLMNPDSRAKLATAYNNYLSDFDNKRLNRKNKKSFKQYGKMKVTLNWGTLESSTPNYGTGDAFLGYEFKKNSPYFTISNYSFENGYYNVVGDATTRESMSLKYYFTKAQMKDLLECISENNIQAAYNEYYEQQGYKLNLGTDDEYITSAEDDVEEIED